MKQRCYAPSHVSYPHYGGRGIRVCERWLKSFKNFLADMGPKPGHEYSLDRIDNDGNYEPGNVRWATRIEQCRNKRANRLLSHDGRTKTLAEWAEVTGVKAVTLSSRIRDGWSVGAALSTPKLDEWDNKRWEGREVILEFDGLSMNLPAWSERLGIKYATLRSRFKKGWSAEQILCQPLLTPQAMERGGNARFKSAEGWLRLNTEVSRG
jgi:hypothetical protein